MTVLDLRGGGALPDPAFWRGRRVLLTGHTGFKGSWLTAWLQQLGAEVLGVSLPVPPSQPSLWDQLALTGVHECRADIAGDSWVGAAIEFDPEVVFHLAAQPLVSAGYAQPALTFATNVQGTVRVMETVDRLLTVRSCVVVTTDKVYEATAPGPYVEGDRLGGHDPYAASKAAAELVVRSWPDKSSTGRRATARAGNVIGGGDWAPDRLLPDLVRAWHDGRPVELRHPEGVRPWQHVLEPLRGYLLYAEALSRGDSDLPAALNFGPAPTDAVTVGEVVAHAATTWAGLGGSPPDPPSYGAVGQDYIETGVLTLDSTAAGASLSWAGRLDWRQAVDLTLAWYAAFLTRPEPSAAELVSDQLSTYSTLMGTLA